MKVVLTVDYYDGHTKVSKPVNLDELPTSQLKLLLMNRNACGITISRYDPLLKMAENITKE